MPIYTYIICSLILLIFFIDVWIICLILFDCVVSNFKSATENRHNQASLNLHTSLLCQFVQVLAGCFRALQDTLKTMSRYDNLGVPKDPIQMVPTKALQTWEDMTWESLKTDMVDKMCEKWVQKMNKKHVQKSIWNVLNVKGRHLICGKLWKLLCERKGDPGLPARPSPAKWLPAICHVVWHVCY